MRVLTKECHRCSGGGEVLSASIKGWGNRHPGTFSPCPDCKGTGRLALSSQSGGGE